MSNNITERVKTVAKSILFTVMVISTSFSAFVPTTTAIQVDDVLAGNFPYYKNTLPEVSLPVANDREASWSKKIPVTCYNFGDIYQTDATPFNTADGTDVRLLDGSIRDDIIAANFLPMNTRVKFPELYGDKVFTTKDRMNERYWERADLGKSLDFNCRKFGLKYTTIEVF